jgi:hypothetical protein
MIFSFLVWLSDFDNDSSFARTFSHVKFQDGTDIVQGHKEEDQADPNFFPIELAKVVNAEHKPHAAHNCVKCEYKCGELGVVKHVIHS